MERPSCRQTWQELAGLHDAPEGAGKLLGWAKTGSFSEKVRLVAIAGLKRSQKKYGQSCKKQTLPLENNWPIILLEGNTVTKLLF